MGSDKKKLTLYFPPEVHYRLKLRAPDERISMSKLVERSVMRLLADPLAQHDGDGPPRRGSLRPGMASRHLAERERLRAAEGAFNVADDLETVRDVRLAEVDPALRGPEPENH